VSANRLQLDYFAAGTHAEGASWNQTDNFGTPALLGVSRRYDRGKRMEFVPQFGF
jgi:hypothetical protein